jgi:hypothetical protein
MGDHNPGTRSKSNPPVHFSYKRKLPELVIDSGSDDDSPKVKVSLSPHSPAKIPAKAVPAAPLIQHTYKEDQRNTASSSQGEKQFLGEVMILTGKVEKQAQVKRAAAHSEQLDAHKTRDSCRCQLY